MKLSAVPRSLYLQVLLAIALAVVLGVVAPSTAAAMKPLGDGFIRLIRLVIAPIVFLTVVSGLAGMGDLKRLGRVGIKSLAYFEIMTTVALALGLVVAKLWKPGAGMHVDPATLDAGLVAGYAKTAASVPHGAAFVLGLIPESWLGAFVNGEMLQVLLVAILFGLGLAGMGEAGGPVLALVERIQAVFFKVVGLIMRLAPVGAFGAMAFTVGTYGLGALLSLGQLMGAVYLSCVAFVLLGLGLVARACGFGILRWLRYLKDELLLVLGTSSSESALPQLMGKLERAGCPKPIVGLVVPTGYSFNLDGTAIYLTLAALFVAQATDAHLSLAQELTLLGVLMLTSKGAAAVTGGGFVTLAATLASTGTLPVAGLALLLGIDRFMSEARALTNLVGNAVAAMAIARWEGVLDRDALERALRPDGRDGRLSGSSAGSSLGA